MGVGQRCQGFSSGTKLVLGSQSWATLACVCLLGSQIETQDDIGNFNAILKLQKHCKLPVHGGLFSIYVCLTIFFVWIHLKSAAFHSQLT